MSLLLLFNGAEAEQEVAKDLGGSRRRQRAQVYGRVFGDVAIRVRATGSGVVAVSPPSEGAETPAPPTRVSAAAAPLRVGLTAMQAQGRRTTRGKSAASLRRYSTSSSASGSVWTALDEEYELTLLGLFA